MVNLRKKNIKNVWYMIRFVSPCIFAIFLGATLNAFKVTPITSIIMASFVDYERSMYPHWGIIRLTLLWLSAVHGPSRKLMSPLGVDSGCVTLPRGDRSSVPRGGPRPATRSIRRPVGTQKMGLFAPLRGQAQCAHNIDGRGMLMFYSHDEKGYVW